MDCQVIQAQLVGFQLGAVDAVAALPIENHLRGCAQCLNSYFAVRRACINSEHGTERPSPAVQQAIFTAYRTLWRIHHSRHSRRLAAVGVAAAVLFGIAIWRRSSGNVHKELSPVDTLGQGSFATDSGSLTAQSLNTL